MGGDVSSPGPPKGILEAVLYAKDLRAIEAFYRRALGLEPFAKTDGRQVFYRCGEQMLLIFNPDVTELPPDVYAKLPVPPHGARGLAVLTGHGRAFPSGSRQTMRADSTPSMARMFTSRSSPTAPSASMSV